MADHLIEHDGVSLALFEEGSGPPVVLLHGLTATHRYVVMGSRALPRDGYRTVSYDARGHGDLAGAGRVRLRLRRPRQ